MTRGVAMRSWTPPQKAEGETKEHYMKLLLSQIEAYRKMMQDQHNTRDKRRAARMKHSACVKQRDKTLAGRE